LVLSEEAEPSRLECSDDPIPSRMAGEIASLAHSARSQRRYVSVILARVWVLLVEEIL
jgi:hypothetical protein